MLKLATKRCVVIGGGKVASRRTASLLQAGANVVVISPRLDEDLITLANTSHIDTLPSTATLSLVQRVWQPEDLKDAFLVVIATDDPAVNHAAAAEAQHYHCLINRADAPDQGDFAIPAHAHHGPVTLAVHTQGISAAASATIRRELSQALSPHWPLLLQAASTWREKIQQAITDPSSRRLRLLALTDAAAINTLLTQGQDALAQRFATLADPKQPDPKPADIFSKECS